MVATATSNLCDSANLVVQGNADEDKLIAAAKAVAAHTAQLLLACQVKADPRSENNRRLQVLPLCCYDDKCVYCVLLGCWSRCEESHRGAGEGS